MGREVLLPEGLQAAGPSAPEDASGRASVPSEPGDLTLEPLHRDKRGRHGIQHMGDSNLRIPRMRVLLVPVRAPVCRARDDAPEDDSARRSIAADQVAEVSDLHPVVGVNLPREISAAEVLHAHPERGHGDVGDGGIPKQNDGFHKASVFIPEAKVPLPLSICDNM